MAKAAAAATDSWGTHIYTLSRVLRTPNVECLQLAKITLLLEQERNHSCGCGQSEVAPYPTPGIKTKTYSHNITEFLKKLKYPLHPSFGSHLVNFVLSDLISTLGHGSVLLSGEGSGGRCQLSVTTHSVMLTVPLFGSLYFV